MSSYEVAAGEEKPAPAEFDPALPSVPVAYPLKTLEELESRSYFRSFHYPFNVASVDLPPAELPKRGRVLVCHDMQGGYVDDKWVQGGNNPDAYAIWHWHLIDIFVYFSHNLVTLPPPCWTNTAHRHGVKVLGTFIAEWEEGKQTCNKLLATKATAQMYAERLVELAAMLGFDGWLLNLEVGLNQEQIPILKEFVSHLTQKMHDAIPGSLVIWYDAVTVDGRLIWQNQLNDSNKPFFDLCDGLFANYSWAERYAKNSADLAGDRKYDVYMGIDVFGRNTFGGGQWTTNVALDVIKKADVSTAIFAPGWLYETKQPPDFETAQNRWWSLVEKSWGVVRHYPKSLPFYSNFDQGRGYHYSVDGKTVSEAPWNNISRQGTQPFLEFSGDSKDLIQVAVDFKESSYSGGGSITFKGIHEDGKSFTARLFDGALVMETPVHFTYSVKSEGRSMLGLALEFSSDAGRRHTFILVPRGSTPMLNQLEGNFSEVIFTDPCSKLQGASDWVKRKCRIDMSGRTLTKINAVCYTEKKTPPSTHSNAGFHAVLGDFAVKTVDHVTKFPPASSWLVEGEYIKWSPDKSSPGLRRLSVKIKWGSKSRDSSYFRYNIYAVKSSATRQEEPEFIGTAEVRAFYVSDLVLSPGVTSVKFIVQLGGVDGAFQGLSESPFLLLS
ncbi:hypothetical protein MLD38_002690 [Melastoma candidum]|uniref:Uncharacterized protein n=1 Tax=Melastoma candidum TaxID=119954 RepID=A0ACB9S064_9MYRT|nr:hypothetical protein MLD38_002690 [Melastoma candidum]